LHADLESHFIIYGIVSIVSGLILSAAHGNSARKMRQVFFVSSFSPFIIHLPLPHFCAPTNPNPSLSFGRGLFEETNQISVAVLRKA